MSSFHLNIKHTKMRCLFVYILLLNSLTYISCQNFAEFRIVGGSPVVHTHEFPYQASIQRKKSHSCGGSIISPTKILTAGHCVYEKNITDFTIVVGTKHLNITPSFDEKFKVIDYIVHPRFERTTLNHDIAVITLNKPIVFDKTKNSTGIRSKVIEPGEKLIVSGWGKTSKTSAVSNILLWVEVTALETKQCKDTWITSKKKLSCRKNVCTTPIYGQGTCKGDSGGPLVDVNNQLVGVVSWGKPCAKGVPDVYTSVPYHYKWIFEQL